MVLKELEAEALKLPGNERAQLAERLLASVRSERAAPSDDPIYGLGQTPVDDDDPLPDASVNHDKYIYEPHR